MLLIMNMVASNLNGQETLTFARKYEMDSSPIQTDTKINKLNSD